MRLRAVLLVLVAFAGCGTDDGNESGEEQRVPPGAVAVVGDEPIPRSDFDHWLAAAAAQHAPPGSDRGTPKPGDEGYESFRDQTMQFLVSAKWLEQEAAAQGVEVDEATVRRDFEAQKRDSFARERDYEAFLETSKQTEEDLVYRVRLELLANALAERAGKQGGGEEDALNRFVDDFRDEYRERTVCAEGFEISDCSNGPDPD